MSERWLPVVGFEGFYEVSDAGRVRSLDRVIWFERKGRPMRRTLVGQILTPCVHTHGYAQIVLSKDGEHTTRLIHAVVLEAFVGAPPEGMEGCHEDNDKWNNCLSNLRYDTHLENSRDRIRHGVQTRGETAGHAVLTEDDVRRIRTLAGTIDNKEIGARFGITGSNVGYILKRKTWKHIPEEVHHG